MTNELLKPPDYRESTTATRRLAKLLITLLTLGLCSIVNASLLEEDLVNPGDGLLTHDTQTGLRWLDVTETQAVSVDDILADAGGWMSAGFRYATLAEVQTLAQHAGVHTFSTVNIRLAENVPGVSLMIALLGNVGTSDPSVDALRGVASNTANSPPFENTSFAHFRALNTATALHLPFGGSTGIANIFVGHFLVKDQITLSIDVDIKPDSDPNSINLCSRAAVPVAILGSETLDVFTIDTETLRFAEASVKVVGKKDPNTMCNYEDINGDYRDDLVCHYLTTDIAGIDGESSSATINGELFDGTLIEGSDGINIVKDSCY